RVTDTPVVSTSINKEDEPKISVEIGIPENYVRETIAIGQNGGNRQVATAQEITLKGNEIAAAVKKEATGLLREVFTTTQAGLDNDTFVRVSILPTGSEQTAMLPGGTGATVLEKPVRPNGLPGSLSNDSAASDQAQVLSNGATVSQSNTVKTGAISSSAIPSLEARLVELWNANKHSPLFWTMAVVLTLVLTAMVLASVSFLFKRIVAVFNSFFGTHENKKSESNKIENR
ncbi:MAG: hypothetical protein Q4G59_05470, partial [Planctomycetia bacterium]|nr:hypothetical protein [Planctomycetia bacterium]